MKRCTFLRKRIDDFHISYNEMIVFVLLCENNNTIFILLAEWIQYNSTLKKIAFHQIKHTLLLPERNGESLHCLYVNCMFDIVKKFAERERRVLSVNFI